MDPGVAAPLMHGSGASGPFPERAAQEPPPGQSGQRGGGVLRVARRWSKREAQRWAGDGDAMAARAGDTETGR